MKSDLIKKISLEDGSVRYRFVVDAGRDPKTGKRRQITRTFDRKKEAVDELARIRHELRQGTYIHPSKLTVDAYLDGWVRGATRDLRFSTKRGYVDALRPVRERLGERPIQQVTKADVENLLDWMATEGRRRGGKPGTGLGARSQQATLAKLVAALETALAEGVIARNVAKLVKPPHWEREERKTWSEVEVRTFLAAAGGDRLHAAWRLALYGLRRGEVLGLRWTDDVSFGSFRESCEAHATTWCHKCYGIADGYELATIQVQQTRVLVEGRVHIEPPKSKNGFRTLPLDGSAAVALHGLHVRQAAERLHAGSAYGGELAGLSWYEGGEYVVVNELGTPVHPEWFSDEFGRVSVRAGVKRIVLHEGRHTTLTLMEHAGVPVSIISRWAGHFDSAFTMRQYVHASDDDLKTGTDALGKIYAVAN